MNQLYTFTSKKAGKKRRCTRFLYQCLHVWNGKEEIYSNLYRRNSIFSRISWFFWRLVMSTQEQAPNKCNHPNLKEYYNETKVFEVNKNKREIVRIVQTEYFYCEECENSFNVKNNDNIISKN